jgi:hypothetical protein
MFNIIQFIILSSLLLSGNIEVKIHTLVSFSVVLYGCKPWSFTLRKEHRLRVSENKVLRRIYEPKTEEVTGGWRKLHNEELHNSYSLPNIIRVR